MGAKGESMKKFLAMLLSLVLCCSFGLLAACDDSANDGTGSISGNYTEATDADYKAFMTAVSDEEKLFPGFDEEFGISADANADISATIGSGEQAINISAKISELSMALSVKSGTAGAEDDVAMNVSIDASAKVPEVPSMDIPAIDGGIKGNIYADETNFYLDATVGEDTMKGKISADALGDLLGSILGSSSANPGVMSVMSAGPEDSAQTPDIDDADVKEFKEQLAEMGVKFEVDMSKGIKARFTASADALETLIAQIMGTPSEAAELPFSFTTANVVLTLEISEDGALAAVAVSADVALSMEANAATMQPAVTASAKLNATVRFGAVTVDLPDDLADYEDLIDVPSTPDQGQQSPSDQPGDVSQAA